LRAPVFLSGGFMNTSQNVLLASHGTDGAQAAEHMALELCQQGGHVHHLIVVPTLWEGMTGDDWLNNGKTRNTFRKYLEDELSAEVDEHIKRVSTAVKAQNLKYTSEVIVGEPDECLENVSTKESFDLIVMGSPRPKGKSGLRSRMRTKKIEKLTTPIYVVPYPDE
jgi:nucleotide-binding universal stress UspA family protein